MKCQWNSKLKKTTDQEYSWLKNKEGIVKVLVAFSPSLPKKFNIFSTTEFQDIPTHKPVKRGLCQISQNEKWRDWYSSFIFP